MHGMAWYGTLARSMGERGDAIITIIIAAWVCTWSPSFSPFISLPAVICVIPLGGEDTGSFVSLYCIVFYRMYLTSQ